MTVFEKTDRFLRNLYETAFYFAVMAVKENFRNYVGRAGTVGAPKPSVVILGNGPSLAEDLPRLIARGEHTAKDVMAVNYFALDERFTTVRPAYYVLSDPMFFRDSVCRDRVAELYRTLAEKVTWPMNLYVQYYNPERFDYRAALPNPNIRIVRFHTQVYRGFRGVEFWLYRHGLGSANFGTVVQVCEYVALLLGYKTLELYGVDHTLLDGLSTTRTVSAGPTGTITTTLRPFRSRSSRRFRTVPIRWPFIWPRSPNCSAATRRCAITPDRSGRGS